MTIFQPSPRYVTRHGERYLPYAKAAPGTTRGTQSGGGTAGNLAAAAAQGALGAAAGADGGTGAIQQFAEDTAQDIGGLGGGAVTSTNQGAGQFSEGVGFRDIPGYGPAAEADTLAVPAQQAVPQADEVIQDFTDENPYDDGGDDQRTFASAGGAGNVNQQGIADRFGYERGQSGIGGLIGAGLSFAGIPGGSFIGNALGGDRTYGNYGTTDAQGNVFGRDGRAYDPVTGRAVGSYADAGSFGRSIAGSYNNLRNAGEGVVQSGLGSYENSIHNFRGQGGTRSDVAARAGRLRGGDYANTGLSSTAGLINQNTFGHQVGPIGPGGPTRASNVITGADLGLQNAGRTTSGRWGTGTDDLVASEFGPGVRNESGTVSTRGGTVVSLSDTSNPGGPGISLLGTGAGGNASAAAKGRAREELARRANEDSDNFTGTGHGTSFGASTAREYGDTTGQGEFGGTPTSNDDGGGGGGGK